MTSIQNFKSETSSSWRRINRNHFSLVVSFSWSSLLTLPRERWMWAVIRKKSSSSRRMDWRSPSPVCWILHPSSCLSWCLHTTRNPDVSPSLAQRRVKRFVILQRSNSLFTCCCFKPRLIFSSACNDGRSHGVFRKKTGEWFSLFIKLLFVPPHVLVAPLWLATPGWLFFSKLFNVLKCSMLIR